MRSAIQVIMILAIGLCSFVFTHRVDAAPSAFSLISPENEATVSTKVLLDWKDSTDLLPLTYTIFLSKNDFFGDSDDIQPIPSITGSCRLLEEGKLEDNSKYYWKVKAISNAGYSETEKRWFITKNDNPVVAWIGGHVYNSFQQSVIPNINIIIQNLWGNNFSFQTDLAGRFCGELNADKPPINSTVEIEVQISATGCMPQSSKQTITLNELTEIDPVTLEFDGIGDMNGDDKHDLKDAVSALQILAGEQPSGVINQGFANEDNKIGLSELIYILQRVSDPSPCATNSVQK